MIDIEKPGTPERVWLLPSEYRLCRHEETECLESMWEKRKAKNWDLSLKSAHHGGGGQAGCPLIEW